MFYVDVYDKNGDYIDRINPEQMTSEIAFSEDANGGQRYMELGVDHEWDAPSNVYKKFNFVRITEVDNDNAPLGRLVYSGWIVKVNRNSRKGVSIVIYGLVSLLKRVYFKSGGSLDVSYTSADPSDILADIIASFQADYPSTGDDWIGTDAVTENGMEIRAGGQISATGKSVDYEFKKVTCFDAIRKCLELSGENWYWKIDKGGDVIFKQKPTSATHSFTVKKDIQEVDAPTSIEDTKNSIYIDYSGGASPVTDSDSTSIDDNGKAEYYSNEDTDATGAGEIAAQKLEELKDEKYLAKITLNNQYDFFSVKAGDSCEVLNVNKDNEMFNDNMFIKNVAYTKDSAIITLEEQELDIASVIKTL